MEHSEYSEHDSSTNQFIHQTNGPQHPQPQEEQFMQYMMGMLKQNPALLHSMKQHLQNKNPSSTLQSPNILSSNLYTHSNHSPTLNTHIQTTFNPNVETPFNPKNSQNRKKGTDVLGRYLPGGGEQKTDLKPETMTKNQFPQKVMAKTTNKMSYLQEQPIRSKFIENVVSNNLVQLPKHVSYDDIPIKSNQAYNDIPIKSNQAYDEIPIKSNQAYDEIPIKSNQNQNINNLNHQIPKTQKVYEELEDRPIKGSNKDFKELLKEQFPQSIIPDQEELENQDQNQDDDQKKITKHFLKRGSRQYLSSAKDKATGSKKSNLDQSALDQNRDRTPKNKAERSISQNRVLNKRNNDKSAQKIDKKEKQKDLSKTSQIKEKTVKTLTNNSVKFSNHANMTAVEYSAVELDSKTKSRISPINIKKGKNVFNDDASSSDSSEQQDREVQEEEEDAPYFKSTVPLKKNIISKIPAQETINHNKNEKEIFPGIYLSDEQIQAVVVKFGKPKKDPKEYQTEKLTQLRAKYTQLCNLVEEEKKTLYAAIQKQKEDFQQYKLNEVQKIKNQRKVMERQLKTTYQSQNSQKDKEDLELLKKQYDREKEEARKKDKNNKIIIDKLKKQNQELKNKLEHLESSTYYSNKQSVEELNKITQPNQKKNYSLNSNKQKNPSKNDDEEGQVKKKSKQDFDETSVKEDKKDKKVVKQYHFIEQESKHQGKKSIAKHYEPEKRESDEDEDEVEDFEKDESSQKEDVVEWTPAMKLSDLSRIQLSIKMVNERMINSLFKFYSNNEYKRYMQMVKSPARSLVQTNKNGLDGKISNTYSDKGKQILFENGTKKESFEDGFTIIYFKNGDIKQKLTDGTIIYYFKEKQVDQITLTNGVNIYRFENNQVEFHFNDGKYIEIRHPDGTIKVLGNQVLRH